MSRVHRSTAAAAAAFVFALALGPAFAEEDDRQQILEQAFQSLDVNGDGAIDAQEAAGNPSLADAFARLAPSGSLDREAFAMWYRAYDQEPAQE